MPGKIVEKERKMAEIVKTYRQSVPATRFIGKRYLNSDRVDGMFGAHWGEWHSKGWFDVLEKQGAGKGAWEDADAQIGFMRTKGGVFEYWIGMFAPAGAEAPEGFDCVDLPACDLGVCWVSGKMDDVFMQEEACAKRLAGEGFELLDDFCCERYTMRFNPPDDVILDICFPVK